MKPFLKWAGGKSRLVPKISLMLPKADRLVEPFAGSCAVFLGLNYPRNLISDANQDLISIYQWLQTDADAFIQQCGALFLPENNTLEKYLELRSEFNNGKMGSLRRSILFVYLNRHCFNGLCRYNKKGKFNVPYGKMRAPYFPKRELIGFANKAKTAEFRHDDFRNVMKSAVPGDVIYVDPPYAPLSATASFDNYAAGGFSPKDQEDLAHLCFESAARGVPVLLSNHDTLFTRRLYDGSRITELEVTRSISATGHKRGTASEILVLFKKGLRRSPQLSLFPFFAA
ncbi:DNA adenine methylase [Thalassospira xiamenensis]|uniref:Site-specific DNA-methyltransferase (adenine-specific) n=1 Tax=Thalassospira xiamenensis TaxID=220697 RepID=A0A285TSV5_9PROT|nr:Dam family site-specific DNA-(adenine-N6)-methyltransferase [Thalassospira xiamenensis]SOC26740.1 DNA adenine methylase [Thalassospira xiamenensis]